MYVEGMLKVREIHAKSILNKSKLSDFTLNCYVGCSHRCLYCYARYMTKFRDRPEDWGEFVDVKINAPEVLKEQIKKIELPKEIYMSTVCDGWQPLEEKYKLSRACLKLLLEAGFSISILTKSKLIRRDFDLLEAHNKQSSLGMTITTLNPELKRLLEPNASDSRERINTLKEAQQKGIEIYVFLGPLIPGFTDTEANLEEVFSGLKDLDLNHIYIDRLNQRWGVLESLKKGLEGIEGEKVKLLVDSYTNDGNYRNYSQKLRYNATKFASQFGLADRVRFCF